MDDQKDTAEPGPSSRKKGYRLRKLLLVGVVAILGFGTVWQVAHGDHKGYRDHGGHGGHRGLMMRQWLEEADTNQDGELADQEISTWLEQRVARADVNGDGTLNLDEFADAAKALMRPRFRRMHASMDDNEDGQVSVAELQARVSRIQRRIRRFRRGHREGE